MSTRQAAVKRYIVTLSAEKRERLEVLIRTGKHSARKLLRARILLKADASEVGRGIDRQPDRCGIAHQSGDSCARPPATRRGRRRRRAHTEALAEFRQTADLRRRQRGEADRPVLLAAT
jgi:hypothetical protein